MSNPDRNASDFIVEPATPFDTHRFPMPTIPARSLGPFAKLSPRAVAFWTLVVDQGGRRRS